MTVVRGRSPIQDGLPTLSHRGDRSPVAPFGLPDAAEDEFLPEGTQAPGRYGIHVRISDLP